MGYQNEPTQVRASKYGTSAYFVVISTESNGRILTAKVIQASGQVDAVNTRQAEIGGKVVAVSRAMPGVYGTGATRLYPVTHEPPPPPQTVVRVSTQPIRMMRGGSLEDAF